jgi:FAD/FMN-containing dehydrogenase/Fe-S oxidoreductase
MNQQNRRIHKRAASGRLRTAFSKAGDGGPLAADLASAIEGEVRFGIGDRALYATDASNYRQVPVGVVIPRTLDDVRATVALCRKHDVPLTARGGGTSLVGQTANTGVVIDFSKYLGRILELDPERRRARVEPGCILDRLRHAAEEHGLTFGPDPATHNHNTLGGMIGNNSCGVHSVSAGRTADNVAALRVLTYRGTDMVVGPTSDDEVHAILAEGGERAEIYRQLDAFRRRHADLIRERFPQIPRRVSGYADLDKLLPEHGFDVAKALVGTEGTCVMILDATLRLVPSPPERALVVLAFEGIDKAGDAVPRVLEHGPLAVEGLDAFLVDAMQRKDLHTDKLPILPEGSDWLLVEFGGDNPEEAEERARGLAEAFADRPNAAARLVTDPDNQKKVWMIREAGLPASAYVPERPETWEGWEDSAVPPERLGDYLRALRALFDRYGYQSPMYGHFGDGLVHCRVSFDPKSESGIAEWRRFMDEAADLVIRHGGSLSGEHGDGQGRGELLERMYGPELVEAFRAFRAIWDPDGRMNPGKIVDPYPITANLRLGPTYKPPEVESTFHFGEEGGFAGAAERCVGVGKCRRVDSEDQVMCPSYIATREEKHSTRGRARLLFEMLHGGALKDGWRAEAVEEALDLCLACKGCKSDCPVNVDMATYKGEFRAHYYKGRFRPRSAYAMGLIYWWSQIASRMPRLANAVFLTPGLSRAAKWLGDIAPERSLPSYAPEPFTTWFRRNRPNPSSAGGRRVLLWPDTFNNFFRPETAIAATRCLEAAGFTVAIPPRPLCCGRPLYDWGMLDRAKGLWRQTIDTLRDDVEAGVPVVGLEPACVAAFKDELVNLLPNDPLARKLSETTHYFSDFMAEHLPDDLGASEASAIVHVHCNHHAIIGKEGERALLNKASIRHRVLPSGCCGMAGSFGFDAGKYDLSMTLAERVLLPAVRSAQEDQIVVASGFSCREQIEQGTGRRTLHAAEALLQQMEATGDPQGAARSARGTSPDAPG